MKASTEVTPTPKNMVEKPVPVGWEEEPVTDGSFRDDKTKMKAPDNASMVLCAGSSRMIFLIFRKPYIKNGTDTNVQNNAHSGLKNPSIICI